MKWFSTLFFAVSCSLALAQDSQKVTLSFPAGTAKAVVEQIAKDTGSKLAVATAAENEIVILNVTDAPLESVLERIALVTSCKWVTDTDGIRRLRPDDELRRKQAREELDFKTAEISKALVKLQDS